MTTEEQIEVIEKTFEDVQRKPKHPTNPSIQALEVIPLFPNFELVSNEYTFLIATAK